MIAVYTDTADKMRSEDKHMIRKTICSILAIILLVSMLPGVSLAAGDSILVRVDIENHYDLARTLAQKINELRTTPDIGYWDEYNYYYIRPYGLTSLSYDYGLENIAMLRAAELSLYYSHDRPDNTSVATLFPSGGYARYQVISQIRGPYVNTIFEDWAAENKYYADQAIRRHFLDKGLTRMGLGCVSVNGIYYWVLLICGGSNTGKSPVPQGSHLNIQASLGLLITNGLTNVHVEEEKLTVKPGQTIYTPWIIAEKTDNRARIGLIDPEWKTKSTGIISFEYPTNEYNKIRGLNPGKTSIYWSASDYYLQVPVHVPCETHTWDAGKVSVKPTYTAKGLMLYTCTVCGEEKTESIPKLEPENIDGILYEFSKSTAIAVDVDSSKITSLVIPDTVVSNGKKYKVTEIAANAFRDLRKMTSLTIGKNVKKIGANAFYKCKKLKKITVLTTKLNASAVGANAFRDIYKKPVFKCPKNKVIDYQKLFLQKGAPAKSKFERK